MSKIPQKPEEIFEEFTEEYKKIFGDALVSIILYGSGARGYYIPKRSDINFLVVLTDEGVERFHSAFEAVKKWKKSKVSIPLFMTEGYIKTSIDSFPIEFLNMKSYYKVVYGKDVFSEIEIIRKDLRLQLEREMKGKLLHLRQAYFQAAGDVRTAEQMIHDSMVTFLSFFPAILFLKGEKISDDNVENINRISLIFKLDAELLLKLYKIKLKTQKLKKNELLSTLQDYTAQIRSLALQVDEIE
ncbi:MAG: hypothetical protein GY863_17535 [bacterium]|nr:hypothetical protein [bacterium]